MKQHVWVSFIFIILFLIGCGNNKGENMAILAVENNDIELISTNVVDYTPSDYICGTSEDGEYRGVATSLVGATNPDYIYSISNVSSDYTVTNKYFYQLFEGDIIYRNNTWYSVKQNINLSFGENQDNATYSDSIIGTSYAAWVVTGEASDGSEDVTWAKESGVVISENGVYKEYDIVSNDATGEMLEYSRSLVRDVEIGNDIRDTLPKIGSSVMDSDGVTIKTYTTLPSLPSYSNTDYFEKLITCEATAVYKVHELQPFDELNTSYAEAENTMQYKIKSLAKFNSFTLAGVTAKSLTYTVRNSSNEVIKTDTVAIDCWLDPDHSLEQGSTTLLISVGEMVTINGTIKIELTNDGTVYLGSFFTNLSIDEGATQFDIKPSIRDYNDYTPDSWGQIPEAVKAKVKSGTFNVIVPYSDFNYTYLRHKHYQGSFVTIDPTDASIETNEFTLNSMTMRGLILSVTPEILMDDDRPSKYYKYSMNFLEVV